jgi:predicted metalloendopeptidase
VYGTFVQLDERAEADLYALIEQLAGDPGKKPGSTAQQVGDLYASFVNEKRLETLGAQPLAPRLSEIDAIRDARQLAEVIGRLSVTGLPGPVGGFIEADAGDPTRVALYLFQGGTALPDRDYYLKDDPKFADIRAKYVEYLTKIFTLAGRARPAESARAVMELETELARIQWTQVESRDALKTYNKYPVSKSSPTCLASIGRPGHSRKASTRRRNGSSDSHPFSKPSPRWCRRRRSTRGRHGWPASSSRSRRRT